MRRCLTVGLFLGLAGCGVPKEFVNQETKTAFNNAGSVAAHVHAKCGDNADADSHCTEMKKKLGEICAGLDELSKASGQPGFNCAEWKPNQ